jgi:ABC-type bacteriocin/lantibiotic exporter with double-glycine peptidase domain
VVAITIFIRALLNFVGIAMLIPILVLILDSENITSNATLSSIYDLVGFTSHSSFVVAVCISVVLVILLKNGAVMLLYRHERDFIYSLYKYLSERLYRGYHSLGLGYIKRSNSALLTRNINVVTLTYVVGVLKPIAAIASEALLFALLFIALMWYAPIAALLSIAIFLPTILIFYLGVRRKLQDIGIKENEAQRIKSRIVAETFRGFADVEIGGAFPELFNRFERAMDEAVTLRKRNATIGMLPQMFTEVGLAAGMALLVVISLGMNSENLSLMFGVFAVAAIRLIPSIRNIMSSWSSIRYNRYSIATLAEADIEAKEVSDDFTSERFHFNDKIELHNLTFQFDDATTPVIKDMSLEIHKGERLGIRGASGAGKTTLFNLILGLYRPTSGEIFIDGESLDSRNIRKWQNTIGYVSQSVFIADMTLAENVAFGQAPEQIDYQRVERALELAELRSFVDTLPDGLQSRIGEQGSRLSGGQRQRIGIARALYKNCDILFFDEATSSLDNRTEENINSAIRRLSTENESLTIVVIAHRESSLEYCDRIITIE